MNEDTSSSVDPDPAVYPGLSRGPGHGHPKPWLAALGGLVVPGLGQVYGRAPIRGLVVSAIFVFLLAPIGSFVVGFLATSRVGLLVGLALMLGVGLLASPIDAWRVARQRRPRTRANRWWIYVFYALVFVLAAPLAIRAIAEHQRFRTFRIPTYSMGDTLLLGDAVLCDMQKPDPSSLRRGDLVVHRLTIAPTETFTAAWRPGADGARDEMEHHVETSPAEDILAIHRVIGLPADSVDARDAVLHVNGAVVDEPYVPDRARESSPFNDFGPVRVPTGTYWLLGDNRNRTRDSREFGPVDENRLVGRVRIVVYSIDPGVPGAPTGSGWNVRWDRIGLRPHGSR